MLAHVDDHDPHGLVDLRRGEARRSPRGRAWCRAGRRPPACDPSSPRRAERAAFASARDGGNAGLRGPASAAPGLERVLLERPEVSSTLCSLGDRARRRSRSLRLEARRYRDLDHHRVDRLSPSPANTRVVRSVMLTLLLRERGRDGVHDAGMVDAVDGHDVRGTGPRPRRARSTSLSESASRPAAPAPPPRPSLEPRRRPTSVGGRDDQRHREVPAQDRHLRVLDVAPCSSSTSETAATMPGRSRPIADDGEWRIRSRIFRPRRRRAPPSQEPTSLRCHPNRSPTSAVAAASPRSRRSCRLPRSRGRRSGRSRCRTMRPSETALRSCGSSTGTAAS